MQKLERASRPELPPIFEVLNNLVCEQKKELEGIRFPRAFITPEFIFGWYQNTERFKEIYRGAMKYSLMPHNSSELQMNERYLSGRLFEELAYFLVAQEQ